MEKTENKHNSRHAEERILEDFSAKYSTMQNSNSRLFNIAIMLLNIFLIVIAFLFLNNKEKIENFSIVYENMGLQNILLIFFVFLGIIILKTIPQFLKVFSKTKKRKFGTCYLSSIKREYFDRATVYSKGYIAECQTMVEQKIKGQHSVDIALGRKITDKISFLLFGLVFMIIGAFAWVKYIPIYLYLIALVVTIINIAIISFTIYFGKNKEEAMGIISSFCKFLYNKKLIKDYEKLFYKIVDTLIVYNKVFKESKIIIWTEIFANLLVYFLKGLVVYLLCYSINMIEGGILFNVLFVWIVMESILSVWPLQKGTLIYELLFVLLFKNYFLDGFVFWAMVIYRVFDYFIYILQYLIAIIILKLCKMSNKKGAMQF